jgi:hypothetical protein
MPVQRQKPVARRLPHFRLRDTASLDAPHDGRELLT